MGVTFQALTWHVADAGPRFKKRVYVKCYGKTRDGAPVHVSMPFEPGFYIQDHKDADFQADVRRNLTRQGMHGSECADTWRHEHKISFLGYAELADGSRVTVPVTWLAFTSRRALNAARQMLQDKGEVLFESNVDVQLQFLHLTGLRPVGWLQLDVDVDSRDVTCSHEQLKNLPSAEGTAPFVIASYDIETYSPDDSFPNPENPLDVVYMIATTFQRLGEAQPYHQHLSVLGDCGAVDSSVCGQVSISRTRNEQQLIEAWVHEVELQNTDIILAYNNFGFDDRYLDVRYRRTLADGVFCSGLPFRAGSWLKTQRSEFAGFSDSNILVVVPPSFARWPIGQISSRFTRGSYRTYI